MIAALAEGESRIDNFAMSADCASTLSVLRQLGVEIRQQGTSVLIKGAGLRGLRPPSGPLDCGNSGTTMRLMAGILAGQEFDSVLTGDDSLRSRPMRRIAEPLNAMGGLIETQDGRAPVKISGGRRLHGIEYTVPIASAQIKSCVLLAGLSAEGETAVIEPNTTRDHSERMLRRFGAAVSAVERISGRGYRTSIRSSSRLTACNLTVPNDISAAAFFMVGAGCLPGSRITMRDVGFGADRTTAMWTLAHFGVRVAFDLDRFDALLFTPGHEPADEPFGDVTVEGGFETPARSSQSNVVNGKLISGLIDEIPILSILGTQHPDGIEIRDAGELRVKESDRISAVVENLRRMNADVDEFDDGFRVGPSLLKGTRVDSFGDHRIAMAFAIAGLLADGETEIDGAECAAVSFPDFFEQLENVAVYE
jgi:3-phosphoshikimate 1-carboxyvinyltransferase